jgi:hypothetical protein
MKKFGLLMFVLLAGSAILTLVQQGERDLDLLKASAFKKFSGT